MYLQEASIVNTKGKAYSSGTQEHKLETLEIGEYISQNDREIDEAEDTEDASETDIAKHEEDYPDIQEHLNTKRFEERMTGYRKELQDIDDLTHPGYKSRLQRIEQAYHDRCALNEVIKQVEMELIEREYQQEKRLAFKELEEKTEELKDNLIAELEEKRRMVENERSSLELMGDVSEVKSITTRKLRRRPNDPQPQLPNEKRRKTSPTQLNLLLEDHEINEDLKMLNRSKMRRDYDDMGVYDSFGMGGAFSPPHAYSSNSNSYTEARIEDGKLFYDKKWYHRGQSVHVESREYGTRFVGVIANVGQSEFYVKKNQDNTKVKIPISHLQRGRFTIKRKSP